MFFLGIIFKIVTAFVLLNIVSADYQLTIVLNSISIEGTFQNGQPCSPFNGLGVKCFPRPKICIEPLEYTNGILEQCVIGSYIDLGIGNDTYAITYDHNAYYGGWYNPSTFKFFGDFNGFSIKLIIWNADGTDYQEIDSIQWNITKGSNQQVDETDARNTNIKLQWSFEIQTQPTAPPTIPTTPGAGGSTGLPPLPSDCSTITVAGKTAINIGGTSVDVYCDGKGGTAIQRRTDGTGTFDSMDISSYAVHFGDPEKSYWLGLDNIHTLTSGSQQYTAVITTCCKTTPYIETYDLLKVGDANTNYALNVTAASGNNYRLMASGINTNKADNGSPFSTYNNFNLAGVDKNICASALKAGGWWFGSCDNNLNGHYYIADNDYTDPATCKTDPPSHYAGNGAGISYPVSISYQKTQIVLYQPNAFRNFDINAAAQDFCTSP